MTDKERTDFFNENYESIEKIIEQRRYKWQLKGIPSLDFSDVKQIILFHIFNKLSQFNISKGPLSHWLNRLVSNQTYNLLRNNYYNHVRPCISNPKCAFNLGGDECGFTKSGKQDSGCPIYKLWQHKKQSANLIKLPLPLENHSQEVFNLQSHNCDYQKAEERLHIEMKKKLKENEWVVYQLMYIENLTDVQIAKKMRWVSGETGRKQGYGNIARLKKIFIQKARKIKEEIDLF
jgi:RNA polymerase sigma factor (sigma-70 family)